MNSTTGFEALTPETLPRRLGQLDVLCEKLGHAVDRWTVHEVGDGNLNLVFIATGPKGAVVVKQALPYVRLVGESWPLPLKRSFFEYHALTRHAARDPGRVPEIYHFDETQALIIMDYLSPHIILRQAFMQGQQLEGVPEALACFLARTLFRGSDLSMNAGQRKSDLALFADNVELCDITENLVFTDPFFDAEMNQHTSPELDEVVLKIRADRDLKVEAQRLKHAFATRAETLLHGDLHTGSVMVTKDDTRVIDPEFAFYGPMSFDIGMLLANFWMSYFSQNGYEQTENRDAMRDYLLRAVDRIWTGFKAEFSRLWQTERVGMLYQQDLFEKQNDSEGADQALQAVLSDIWEDLLGFAGIEIHRRILGLAHNADFEAIEDTGIRAHCETKALRLGRYLAVKRKKIADMSDVHNQVTRIEQENL